VNHQRHLVCLGPAISLAFYLFWVIERLVGHGHLRIGHPASGNPTGSRLSDPVPQTVGRNLQHLVLNSDAL
jgi:hypothetical protein